MDILFEILKDTYREAKDFIITSCKFIRAILEYTYMLICAYTIFKALNLKPIAILPRLNKNMSYCNTYNEIYIGLFMLMKHENNWNEVFDYIDYNFKSRKDKLFFIMAHEIGHSYQALNHFDWKNKHDRNKHIIKHNISARRYRLLKTEKNADNLALGVIKRLSKRAVTNV